MAEFETIIVPYEANPKKAVLSLAVVTAGALLAYSIAVGEDLASASVLKRFDPETARVVVWGLFECCVGFTLVAFYALVRPSWASGEIVVGSTSLKAPKCLVCSRMVNIRYADIERVETITVSHQKFLRIVHHGKKLDIAPSGLPANMTVGELARELIARQSAFGGIQ